MTRRELNKYKYPISHVHYKLLEHGGEHIDRQNAMRNSDDISSNDWIEDLTIYLTNIQRIAITPFPCPKKFERMCDGHFG